MSGPKFRSLVRSEPRDRSRRVGLQTGGVNAAAPWVRMPADLPGLCQLPTPVADDDNYREIQYFGFQDLESFVTVLGTFCRK